MTSLQDDVSVRFHQLKVGLGFERNNNTDRCWVKVEPGTEDGLAFNARNDHYETAWIPPDELVWTTPEIPEEVLERRELFET